MPSDWMFNHDLSSGRLKCHGNGDLVRGRNMDWARVEGSEYVKQKLFLYFAIPPGEIINDPEVGCCLHNELFNKNTKKNLAIIRIKLESELQKQLPELGVHNIEVRSADKDSITLKVIGYSTWMFQIHRNDLVDLRMLDVFGGGAA